MAAREKKSDAPMSAQVILRPRAGKSPAEPITSANVHQYTPSREAMEKVASWFESKEFEIGTAVGTSFSITAPRSTFERVFATKFRGRKSRELPLKSIARSVAAEIEEVTFTPPPDFGPTSY